MAAQLKGVSFEERDALVRARYAHVLSGRNHEITWLSCLPPAARARYGMRLMAIEDELEASGASELDRALAIAVLMAEREVEITMQRAERTRRQSLREWKEANLANAAAQSRLGALLVAWYSRQATPKMPAHAARAVLNASRRTRSAPAAPSGSPSADQGAAPSLSAAEDASDLLG